MNDKRYWYYSIYPYGLITKKRNIDTQVSSVIHVDAKARTVIYCKGNEKEVFGCFRGAFSYYF